MARRDMTEKQYRAAAQRRGFKVEYVGYLHCEETRTSYGPIIGPNGIDFRTSLSKAIRSRTRDLAKK